MGAQSLKESTKGQAVAIALVVQAAQGKPSLSPESINSAVQDFGTILQSLPNDPREMGQVWLSKAYPGEQPDFKDPCLAPWLKKALGLYNKLCFFPARRSFYVSRCLCEAPCFIGQQRRYQVQDQAASSDTSGVHLKLPTRAGTAQAAPRLARPSTRRSHRHSAADHSTKASLALAVAAKHS